MTLLRRDLPSRESFRFGSRTALLGLCVSDYSHQSLNRGPRMREGWSEMMKEVHPCIPSKLFCPVMSNDVTLPTVASVCKSMRSRLPSEMSCGSLSRSLCLFGDCLGGDCPASSCVHPCFGSVTLGHITVEQRQEHTIAGTELLER